MVWIKRKVLKTDSSKIYVGDCLKVLKRLPDNLVDAVITDPPYHLQSIVNRFGKKGAAKAQVGATGVFARKAAGFMQQTWDGGDIAFNEELWAEILRVSKPGAHLAAFSGSRTFPKMATAITASGWSHRDTVTWHYATGFPRSVDIGKAGGPDGLGTALKPSSEPIMLARAPLVETAIVRQVLATGTGAINIGQCRIEGGRWPTNVLFSHSPYCGEDECDEDCPVAELIEQGAKEEYFPVFRYCKKPSVKEKEAGLENFQEVLTARMNPGGLSSDPKWAPTKRRNSHATVKPLDLMEWLVRLLVPTGGLVLDPFLGSGTTLAAASRIGFQGIGIEQNFLFARIAKARIKYWERKPAKLDAEKNTNEAGLTPEEEKRNR